MFLENPMLKVYVFRDEMEQSYIVVVTGGRQSTRPVDVAGPYEQFLSYAKLVPRVSLLPVS